MYLVIASASYNKTFQESSWYFPVGIITAILANLIWLWIAKIETDPSSLMIKGLFWDVMLLGCYLIIPILFYGAKFTPVQGVGVALTVTGLLLTKI